jgi:hypothetical protein
MHYEHYTTLQQAFDLLSDEAEWKELTDNYTNYYKVGLIWWQVIGYLELKGLPGVDRFAFARAFDDEERTTQCKYDENGSFPDYGDAVRDSEFSGLGFDDAIFGWEGLTARVALECEAGGSWKTHVEQKCQTYRTYAATATVETSDRVCNLLK